MGQSNATYGFAVRLLRVALLGLIAGGLVLAPGTASSQTGAHVTQTITADPAAPLPDGVVAVTAMFSVALVPDRPLQVAVKAEGNVGIGVVDTSPNLTNCFHSGIRLVTCDWAAPAVGQQATMAFGIRVSGPPGNTVQLFAANNMDDNEATITVTVAEPPVVVVGPVFTG